MERLWAPWRMPYIRSHKDSARCFLCAAVRSRSDAPRLVVRRGKVCFAILNRYPYTNGHLMIAPVRHVGKLEALDAAERQEMLELAAELQAALGRALRPDGYNLGMNLGRVAGAGLLGHLHLHLVPRWNGDTNFMPVTAGTKVLPMSLPAMYRALKKALGSRRSNRSASSRS